MNVTTRGYHPSYHEDPTPCEPGAVGRAWLRGIHSLCRAKADPGCAHAAHEGSGRVQAGCRASLKVWLITSGYFPNRASHDIDGPNRNRWFTVLKNGGSFHGELLNYQMVIPLKMMNHDNTLPWTPVILNCLLDLIESFLLVNGGLFVCLFLVFQPGFAAFVAFVGCVAFVALPCFTMFYLSI